MLLLPVVSEAVLLLAVVAEVQVLILYPNEKEEMVILTAGVNTQSPAHKHSHTSTCTYVLHSTNCLSVQCPPNTIQEYHAG